MATIFKTNSGKLELWNESSILIKSFSGEFYCRVVNGLIQFHSASTDILIYEIKPETTIELDSVAVDIADIQASLNQKINELATSAIVTAIENISVTVDPADLNAEVTQLLVKEELANLNTNIGAQADAEATTDTGTFSFMAFVKRMLSKLTALVTGTTAVNTSVRNLLDRNNGTFDAFYRQRFSEPYKVFDSKQIADKQPLFWDDQLVSGSGGASTYNVNQASTTLSVALNTAATRVRQTFRRFNYQPGNSQLFIQTGVFGVATSGITRRAGLFDSNNGIFFEQISTGVWVVLRSNTSGSPIDTRIAQSDWNIDKLDGTGDSGIILDFSKTLIWFCDFEWLGVGTVRYGFFIGGKPYYCHEINNSNINTVVYMSNPNLPLRFEISSTGTNPAAEFTQICSSVISEGGVQLTGYPRSITRTTVLTTGNNTNLYPLITYRLKSGYLHSTVKAIAATISCSSTADYAWYLIINPTPAGTAFAYTGETNGSIEFDISRTGATTVSGGTVIASGIVRQQNENAVINFPETDFYPGANIDNTPDLCVLAVQRLTGTTESFNGTFIYKDIQ